MRVYSYRKRLKISCIAGPLSSVFRHCFCGRNANAVVIFPDFWHPVPGQAAAPRTPFTNPTETLHSTLLSRKLTPVE